MEQEKIGLLEESAGVKSAKRYFGAGMISGGGLLLLVIGIVAIFRPIADSASALQAGTTLAITGAGLLGVGVLEGLGRSK
jgi:hypothetical protein